MSTDYPYQIEGCSGKFSSEINGYMFTVTIKLTGVAGANDILQMFNALTDSNVPLIGSDLSGINVALTGCWLRDISCTPLGDGDWRVVLDYQHSPLNDVTGNIKASVYTQVSEVQSNKGLPTLTYPAGKPIVLNYQYPADYGGTSATQEQIDLRGFKAGDQGGTFSKLVPETTRIYRLREKKDPTEYREIVGTVNDAHWIAAGDTGKWMLTDISGDTDNSQQVTPEWVNTYTFQYKVDGWQPEVVYTDKNTNEPVPAPVADESKVTVDAYETNNFATLFPDFRYS